MCKYLALLYGIMIVHNPQKMKICVKKIIASAVVHQSSTSMTTTQNAKSLHDIIVSIQVIPEETRVLHSKTTEFFNLAFRTPRNSQRKDLQ